MAFLTHDVALDLALDKYKDNLPPGIDPVLSDLELAWVGALAARAAVMTARVQNLFPISWTLRKYFLEGMNWQIRMELPYLRKASLMVERGEQPTIPDTDTLERTLMDPVAFGEWWDQWAPHVYLAVHQNNPNLAPVYKLLWPPRYIRIQTGWRDVIGLWIEMQEGLGAAGPKPRRLIELAKEVIRAFPVVFTFPEGEIDLLTTAVRIVTARLAG